MNVKGLVRFCAYAAIVLWLSGCDSEDFAKVESSRSPLITGFESYASIQEVTSKLPKDLQVQVVADTSLAKNSSEPPYKVHSISIAPFEHLNHSGQLLLTFYNDRLEQCFFYPDKFKSYVTAIEKTGLALELGSEAVQGNTVIWLGKDEDQVRFVGWADKRLREQQRRWLVRYD